MSSWAGSDTFSTSDGKIIASSAYSALSSLWWSISAPSKTDCTSSWAGRAIACVKESSNWAYTYTWSRTWGKENKTCTTGITSIDVCPAVSAWSITQKAIVVYSRHLTCWTSSKAAGAANCKIIRSSARSALYTLASDSCSSKACLAACDACGTTCSSHIFSRRTRVNAYARTCRGKHKSWFTGYTIISGCYARIARYIAKKAGCVWGRSDLASRTGRQASGTPNGQKVTTNARSTLGPQPAHCGTSITKFTFCLACDTGCARHIFTWWTCIGTATWTGSCPHKPCFTSSAISWCSVACWTRYITSQANVINCICILTRRASSSTPCTSKCKIVRVVTRCTLNSFSTCSSPSETNWTPRRAVRTSWCANIFSNRAGSDTRSWRSSTKNISCLAAIAVCRWRVACETGNIAIVTLVRWNCTDNLTTWAWGIASIRVCIFVIGISSRVCFTGSALSKGSPWGTTSIAGGACWWARSACSSKSIIVLTVCTGRSANFYHDRTPCPNQFIVFLTSTTHFCVSDAPWTSSLTLFCDHNNLSNRDGADSWISLGKSYCDKWIGVIESIFVRDFLRLF